VTDQSILARHLRDLARHMAWADETVWKSVLAAPQAESDTKIGHTLHHIHLVQHIFLQAWTKVPFAVRERADFATLADVAQWGLEGRRAVVTFVEHAGEGELEQPFRMPWAAHFEQHTKQPAAVHTLGESALQVFLHTQHHRGQVCTRLREIGGAPPTVDFIVWLWQGRPPHGS
jgi:uncharacterized damage-inducible protein DinB